MEQVKALAIALAAANGHPNPHAYADSVLEHMANPPAEPEAPVEQAAEPEAPAETGEAEKPADPQ